MHDDDIVLRAFPFQVIDAVADGFLPRVSAGNDPLELVNAILPRVSPDNIMPSVDEDKFDRVDLGMILKRLQRLEQDGLVIDIDKLLGDVIAHSGAGSPRYDKSNIHYRSFSLKTDAKDITMTAVLNNR